jgi:hypothetical protein
MPLSFPVQSPEVAAYFGEIARPGDTASVPPERLFLLSQVAVDQKMVAFRSWADAQSQLDALAGTIGWVMYNPEHWDLTPEEEQQDLATIVQQFAEAAHARGLLFMFAPDRQYAELHLDQVAPHVDAVMLQGQRLQHDPQTFAAWVLGMAKVAHTANPDIQVFVQVGATRGTAEEMYAALQTVAGDIDGIAVWSMPRTLDILREFVELLRGDLPPVAATEEATAIPSAVPSRTATLAAPTETPTPLPPSLTPAATETVPPTPTSQANEDQSESAPTAAAPTAVPLPGQTGPEFLSGGWVTAVLLFVGGVGVGLVLGFVLGWALKRGS